MQWVGFPQGNEAVTVRGQIAGTRMITRHRSCEESCIRMKRSFNTLLLILAFVIHARSADPQKINAPFGNIANPFLQVLGLNPYRISLSRDSTRIVLEQGVVVDIILVDRRLWSFRQYDADGMAMDSNNLSAGTGRVHFVNGPHAYDATFDAGVLHGPMMRADLREGAWVPMLSAQFRSGLLQGEMRYQSLWSPQYVTQVDHYNDGIIWMSESYGRRNWFWGFLWFAAPRVRDVDKVCSRTVYVAGRMQAHSCLLSRKCRSCGI